MSFSLTNKTKGSLADIRRLPFAKIKDAVLGVDYDLSLVFVPPSEMKKLNNEHRKKNYATDILSFRLEPKAGEMFLTIQEARKEARKFDRDFTNFLQFLFIHGCVHLKGFAHGSTMEREEAKFRKQFGI